MFVQYTQGSGLDLSVNIKPKLKKLATDSTVGCVLCPGFDQHHKHIYKIVSHAQGKQDYGKEDFRYTRNTRVHFTRENTHIPGKEMVKDQARGHKAVKGTCDGKARPHGSASNTKA